MRRLLLHCGIRHRWIVRLEWELRTGKLEWRVPTKRVELRLFARGVPAVMYSLQIPMRKIICVAVLFCGFAALPSVPQTVPSASAENLDGKPDDPFRPSTGKLVVLLLVRTDCPISNRYT